MGWSADQGGRRPPYWAHRLSLSSVGLLSGPTCQWLMFGPLLCWISSLVGPPIHVAYMWRLLIGQRLAPWLKRV